MANQNPLEITLVKEQNYSLMKITGEISYNDLSDFEKKANEALQQPEKNILIDLSQLTYISSAGLRVMLKLAKELSAMKKNLALFGLNEFVSSVFQIAGFDKIFNIHKDKKSILETL